MERTVQSLSAFCKIKWDSKKKGLKIWRGENFQTPFVPLTEEEREEERGESLAQNNSRCRGQGKFHPPNSVWKHFIYGMQRKKEIIVKASGQDPELHGRVGSSRG